jgi:hypothetical protein
MFCFVDELVSTHDCAWFAGNIQANVLSENKELQVKGETAVLQNSACPSQQKFFEFLGMQKMHILLHSLSYILVSLSSWGTSCDITRLEVQQLL